ncbi:uncharacterized protein BX663DRAFT_496428 [Cokeromyces recurvatus]|uniref:uncharacterized protein n=1 Tax=Cokeromyces recurvatus TaxID=90255 RepID=UPI00221F2E26|nr:uncharacterized protein BX663DRAFT_496428 [Cokeromyces recurvatus]KAI7906447.1 hypothetical protein BX663DRAFT_496428 [Cokeromyces recurvatus]
MTVLLFVNEFQTIRSKSRKSHLNNSSSKLRSRKAPRPRNSFILYRQEKQKSVTISTMKLHSKDLSKIFAEMWKNEKEEVRMKYERMAEEEKLMHGMLYPKYKYRPKQRKKSLLLSDKCPELEKKEKNELLHEENLPIKDNPNTWTHQNEEQKNIYNGNHFELSVELFDYIDAIPPSTPPSNMVDEFQLFPNGSKLDYLSFKDYELYTLVSLLT